VKKTCFFVLFLLWLSCLPSVYADDTSEMAKLLVPLMFVLIFVGFIICMVVTVVLLVVLVIKT